MHITAVRVQYNGQTQNEHNILYDQILLLWYLFTYIIYECFFFYIPIEESNECDNVLLWAILVF